MKKSYAFALMSGLLMLGSCASDAPEYPQMDPIDEEGNIGYIRFTINNSDTRANTEPTNAGNADESAIDHLDFLFTGVDNQPFKVRVNKDDIEGNKAVVKLPKMPKYVAVIVNGNGSYDNITDLTQSSHAVDHYTNPNAAENQQFYMSSSRYWDASQSRQYRTNISASQVYKSADAAKAGTAVSITVERYVAKVNINSEIELTNDELDPMTGEHAGHMKDANAATAKVSFKPEYVFLTGVNDKTFRVKDLPSWSDMPNELTEGEWCNDANGKRSFWVGNTAGSVQFQTLNTLNGTTENNATWAKWMKPYGDPTVFYPFENKQNSYAKKTSVVVAGKYTVTDAAGADLADTTDGTFYLVAFENNFTVCKTEADAIKAMGGNADTDTLVPEGVNSTDLVPGDLAYNDDKWTGWTGWMKIKGSNNVIRCIKYTGGYGYYSKEIVRYNTANDESFEAIVRNHLYTINIKGIQGMGVGIPDPDQPIINIPNPDPSAQNYFLNMSVTVAPWKVVPAQDAEWK